MYIFLQQDPCIGAHQFEQTSMSIRHACPPQPFRKLCTHTELYCLGSILGAYGIRSFREVLVVPLYGLDIKPMLVCQGRLDKWGQVAATYGIIPIVRYLLSIVVQQQHAQWWKNVFSSPRWVSSKLAYAMLMHDIISSRSTLECHAPKLCRKLWSLSIYIRLLQAHFSCHFFKCQKDKKCGSAAPTSELLKKFVPRHYTTQDCTVIIRRWQ